MELLPKEQVLFFHPKKKKEEKIVEFTYYCVFSVIQLFILVCIPLNPYDSVCLLKFDSLSNDSMDSLVVESKIICFLVKCSCDQFQEMQGKEVMPRVI